MKKASIFVFYILMITLCFPAMSGGGQDYEILTVSSFAGGNMFEKVYHMDQAGDDDSSLNIEIIKRSDVQNANFKVQGGMYKGTYPLNPRIDVGDDGDFDWAFNEVGYGRLGYQNTFSTGRSEQIVFVSNQGYSKDISIKLPKDANVLSANITIQGTTVSDSSYNSEQYVITNDYSGKVSLAISNFDGTFQSMESFGRLSTDFGDNGIGIGDFDNDGDLDFIVATPSYVTDPKPIYYFEKLGSGKYFADKKLAGTCDAASHAMDIGIGDFDNDKDLDFFMSGWQRSNGRIFYGDGTGKFYPQNFNFGLYYSYAKSVEDLDGDGYLDLVVTGGDSTTTASVHWFRNKGDGSFNSKVDLGISNPSGYGLVVEDFDGDGKVDILSGSSDGKWYFSKGNGDGSFGSTFGERIYTGLDVGGNHPGFGHAYDFDFDGNMDLICSSDYSAGNIKYYRGNGDGTFRFPTDIGYAGSNTAGISGPPSTSIGSPLNVSLDIGGDNIIDWKSPVEDFKSTVKYTGFEDDLNVFLSNADKNITNTDKYGNVMVDIPVKLIGDSPGNVIVKNLEIKYDYSASVDENPGSGDLAAELNELIQFYESEYNLNVTIPVLVTADSAGWLKISDLYIEYKAPNKRPTLKLPQNQFQIFEDSGRHKNFIDMDLYVNDDFWGSGILRYELISNSEPEGLNVFIHSHYMDILPGKDFYGKVQLRVMVIDNGNDDIPNTKDDLWSYSNLFNITVLPRNDAPRIFDIDGFDPHETYLQFNATENERTNITISALDIDNDPIFPLKFNWEFQDSEGRNIRSDLNLELYPGSYIDNVTNIKIFTVVLSYIPDQYEVNLGSIYITLTVTDNNGSNPLKDITQFVIRAINVNDPPRIAPIENYNINEDSTLVDFIYATDSDRDILTFSTNRSDSTSTDYLPNFNIDSYTGKFTFTPRNENVGIVLVTVYVDDGAGMPNSIVSRNFTILVINTNDAPHVNRITFEINDANPDTAEVSENLTVQFFTETAQDDDSGDKISYEWDFNDEDGFQIQSTAQNPTWEFPSTGKYTITLRVRDSEGATNQTTLKIRVYEPPEIDNGGPDGPGDGKEVNLLETGEGFMLILVLIIITLVIAIILAIVIKKRRVKEVEEEVTPFSDKELKVILPEDVARDLATRIRLEKGVYVPPKNLKVPQAGKDLLGASECSTPAEIKPFALGIDDVSVSLPSGTAGRPPGGMAAPAALPPAKEAAEDENESESTESGEEEQAEEPSDSIEEEN